MLLPRGIFGVNVVTLVIFLIAVHFSLTSPLDFFIFNTSSGAFIFAGSGANVEAKELTIGDFTKLLHSSGV